MSTYVYVQSEHPNQYNDFRPLWTVGFYDPKGRWVPENDYGSATEASARAHYLNGGAVPQEVAA